MQNVDRDRSDKYKSDLIHVTTKYFVYHMCVYVCVCVCVCVGGGGGGGGKEGLTVNYVQTTLFVPTFDTTTEFVITTI